MKKIIYFCFLFSSFIFGMEQRLEIKKVMQEEIDKNYDVFEVKSKLGHLYNLAVPKTFDQKSKTLIENICKKTQDTFLYALQESDFAIAFGIVEKQDELRFLLHHVHSNTSKKACLLMREVEKWDVSKMFFNQMVLVRHIFNHDEISVFNCDEVPTALSLLRVRSCAKLNLFDRAVDQCLYAIPALIGFVIPDLSIKLTDEILSRFGFKSTISCVKGRNGVTFSFIVNCIFAMMGTCVSNYLLHTRGSLFIKGLSSYNMILNDHFKKLRFTEDYCWSRRWMRGRTMLSDVIDASFIVWLFGLVPKIYINAESYHVKLLGIGMTIFWLRSNIYRYYEGVSCYENDYCIDNLRVEKKHSFRYGPYAVGLFVLSCCALAYQLCR